MIIVDSKDVPSTPDTYGNSSHDLVINILHDEGEAPPSYAFVEPTPTSGRSFFDRSSDASSISGSSSASYLEPSSSSMPPVSPSTTSLHTPPVFTPKQKSWFGSKSRKAKEVREWAVNQIGDLLGKGNTDIEECRSVLSGCAEAFSTKKLTFSAFLQEPLVENHTYFYWSIVNRSDEATRFPPLLSALLSFASPVTEETRADVRLACLLTNDQPLHQSLQCHRDFMRLPTSHELIFGEVIPYDDITVENMPSAEPSFQVKMEIPHFMKRMNFEKEVTLEFIAQRELAFSVPSGKHPSWTLTLTLLGHSDPTPIDSRFVIEDASPASSTGLEVVSKPKPPVSIRLKASMLIPSKKDKVTVSLEDGSLIGSSLRSP
ncbi:hypothetical protein BDP27DRAFT_1305268 [Rhodocollybia butyracea]|uniref:Uncharacterized protein n=1 Tax=Rhodocollybia butyracea TaxID=206335 RepID=A0A9P5P530_9AGAR|nr:hypothetical protein BDP27DRAFT_1305268 [Rhodocollybia butyracea]